MTEEGFELLEGEHAIIPVVPKGAAHSAEDIEACVKAFVASR